MTDITSMLRFIPVPVILNLQNHLRVIFSYFCGLTSYQISLLAPVITFLLAWNRK